MKTKNILVSIIGIFISISFVSASTYNNMEDFEKNEGTKCESVTDGCNTCFMQDGKVAGCTRMFCNNHKKEWKCIKYKNTLTSKKNQVENNYFYGKITKIENGKDGKQIEITLKNGKVYTTAISISEDKIINGKYSELYLGTRIKIYYFEVVEKTNLLIGNKVEIMSKGLSQNDENLYKTIHKRLDYKYQNAVNKILFNYLNKINNFSKENKQIISNKLINKLDIKIGEFLLKYPQDIALPKKANTKYLILDYLKLELMKLDFVDNNIIGWNGALKIAKNGNIKLLGQTHDLTVDIYTLDGKSYITKEEKIDDYIKLKEICSKKCENIELMTE